VTSAVFTTARSGPAGGAAHAAESTVTVTAALVAVQPVAFVTVTVYVPAALTLMDCVVAPLDQRYEEPALALSVTLPPGQNVVGPEAVIVGVGQVVTTTGVAALVALHPVASVTVTV
jgi:hypothetical protein